MEEINIILENNDSIADEFDEIITRNLTWKCRRKKKLLKEKFKSRRNIMKNKIGKREGG